MSHHKFDKLISEVSNEQVDDEVVSRAGDVYEFHAGSGTANSARAASCEDFQALIHRIWTRTCPSLGDCCSKITARVC